MELKRVISIFKKSIEKPTSDVEFIISITVLSMCILFIGIIPILFCAYFSSFVPVLMYPALAMLWAYYLLNRGDFYD